MSRRVAAAGVALVAAAAIMFASVPASAAEGDLPGAAEVEYPGDPQREAALVEAETARLTDVRTVTSSAEWNGIDVSRPYRVATAPVGTLVLVPRSQAYTLTELAGIAPDSVVRLDDGRYLVQEHLTVLDGATLSLDQHNPRGVLLISSREGFASIVSLGGSLHVAGNGENPVRISSFDPWTAAPDTQTADGRAYIRALGGRVLMDGAEISDLGFWSGVTGGLSLTGTEPSESPVAATSVAEDADAAVQVITVPADEQGSSSVTGELRNLSVTGNVFGIFVTRAANVVIEDATVADSLVDGIVFHRSVTDSTIADTSVSASAVDGVVIDRSSAQNELRGLTSADNGRNGLTIDGTALAEGPNAVGIEVATYGGNAVAKSTFTGNARYGVEVRGGRDVSVTASRIADNDMGIVVAESASQITLSGNTVEGEHRHGIALRDGVSDVTVTRNTLSGAQTGIYLRNAGASVFKNTISDVTRHGITVVGSAATTEVLGNVVDGSGPRAIDSERALGALVERNQVDGWSVSRSLAEVLTSAFQPLTVVWLAVIVLVVASIAARNRARRAGIRHPYAEQVPLTSYTRGVIDRASIGRERA